MVDEDKKKPSEYSELSDLFEDTGSAPSLDDLLKDLGADLDAVTPAKKPKSTKSKNKDKQDVPSGAAFEALFADSPIEPALPPPNQSKEGIPTGAEFDALFADSPTAEPVPPRKVQQPAPAQDKTTTGTDFDALFADTTPSKRTGEKDLFEDMSVDFPESKPGQELGDNALFDYEPQSEANVSDIGGASDDLNHMDMDEGTPPPPKKGFDVKRLAVRLAVMGVLAVVIYGGLKFFLGKKSTEMVAMPAKHAVHIPPVAAAPIAPVAPVAPIVTTPPAAAPAPTVVSEAPQNLPMPGAVTSGLPAQPAVTIPATGMTTEMVTPTNTTTTAAPSPAMPSMPTPVAVSTTQPVVTQAAPPTANPANLTLGTGDVNEKLDKLEVALQSIDQRLAQVSGGAMTETQKAQQLERYANESNGPEVQATLDTAVKKMQALDTKLDRLNDLQKQVRILNKEVQSLKEDVVTQTNIVGHNQRMINENTQSTDMQETAPVKMMVQAIIPGRAWLRSERGELLTVIPGDEVPGYGRVVSIDAASGSVVTSTRAVFREQ